MYPGNSVIIYVLPGNSYTTYLKEEVGSYRLVIGNQTCVFEQESDPSMLRCVWETEAVVSSLDDIE